MSGISLSSEIVNYQRIEKAIAFIRKAFKHQPSLEEIAEEVGLSPFHFQRLFTEWAGVSPKEFLQYTSINYAKSMIRTPALSLFDTALETGLSGNSRLHALFIKIVAMSPGEYKEGGKNLKIEYCFSDTIFGRVLIASTTTGICHLGFVHKDAEELKKLSLEFPNAHFLPIQNDMHKSALGIFNLKYKDSKNIKLHLRATPFRLQVWEALLNIPSGKLSSYGQVAEKIGQKSASRAVGNAIGSNPIAFLIPCHRVIQGNGNTGNYMWGADRKATIIALEASTIGK